MILPNCDWTELPREAPAAEGRRKIQSPRALIEAVGRAAKEGGYATLERLVWRGRTGKRVVAVVPLRELGRPSRPGLRLAVAFCWDGSGHYGLRWHHCLLSAEGGGVCLRRQNRAWRQTSGLDPLEWATYAVDALSLRQERYFAEFDEARKIPMPLGRWQSVLFSRQRLGNETDRFTWRRLGKLEEEFRRSGGRTALDGLLSASRAALRPGFGENERRLEQMLALYQPVLRLIEERLDDPFDDVAGDPLLDRPEPGPGA